MLREDMLTGVNHRAEVQLSISLHLHASGSNDPSGDSPTQAGIVRLIPGQLLR